MAEIELLNQIREKASRRRKTIVLPESHDERVLKAAEILTKENIASIITLGNENKIREDAAKLGVDLTGIRIINPETSDKLSDFSNIFYNTRKHKGVTIEQARETIKRDLFFGGMMVREGMADGSVSGSFATAG
ncbi:MAG: phosphate acyltransferase, partial [Ignavibacteria bacterium]|nr:phosphate acyltransferase [Ignavibacteria bacterium]